VQAVVNALHSTQGAGRPGDPELLAQEIEGGAETSGTNKGDKKYLNG